MFEYEDSQYYIFQFQGQMTPTEPLRKGLKLLFIFFHPEWDHNGFHPLKIRHREGRIQAYDTWKDSNAQIKFHPNNKHIYFPII